MPDVGEDHGSSCCIAVRRDGGGGLRVVVSGELDMESAPTLETVLDECLPSGVPIGVDLGAVTFIDRHALDVLVSMRRRAHAGLRLVATSACVDRLVDLVRADELRPLLGVA